MLFAIVGLSGFVMIDEFSQGGDRDVAAVEPAEAAAAEPARPASAPQRVVDTAGFPVVPEPAADSAPVEVTEVEDGPVVTVNGQPLGSTWDPARAAVATAGVTSGERTAQDGDQDSDRGRALVAPVPIPRPAGLELPGSGQGTAIANRSAADYEAITASAYPREGTLRPPPPIPSLSVPDPAPNPAPQADQLVGPVGVVEGFLTYEERQRLAGGENLSPEAQGLVQVIGPNGDLLWVYPDQARQFDYRAPSQPLSNPFGIIFD